VTAEADRFFMGLALELARTAAGRTSPNPLVGCVVARGGRVVGRGFHPAAGQPHAEVFALDEARQEARGADLYVTLEPCSHHGRTPPCVDRVIRSGVRRVVAAMADPNPLVAGAGLGRLREAGIEVLVGVREDEAARMNEAFCVSVRERRAFVHLKLAATLDGRIATRTGHSRWITSEASRLRVHRLRDTCGAVVVGVGTAVSDDPRLTVRLPGAPERRILRVVVDPHLRAPASLAMFGPEEVSHTAIACSEEADPRRAAEFEARGARLLRLSEVGGRLALGELLARLYAEGIMEVLVEGGGETARGFLAAGLVGRVHLFLAPKLLGGRDAVPMLGGTSPERIDEAVQLAEMEVEQVGPDLYLTGRPAGR